MFALNLLHIVLDFVNILTDVLNLLEELIHAAGLGVDTDIIGTIVVIALGLKINKIGIKDML